MTTMIMLDRVAPVARDTTRRLVAATGAKAWGFYLGGAGHRHDRSAYDAASRAMLADEGLALVPIWVGAQSGLSHARGVEDARKAVARHEQTGSHGDLIFADVERRASEGHLVEAAQYLSGWTEVLHGHGLRSGLYGAFDLPGAVARHSDAHPDVAWIARYSVDTGTRFTDLAAMRARFPKDPRDVRGVDRGHFTAAGRRAWQFFGDVVVHGVGIDVSVVDTAMVTAKAPHPAPHLKPHPVPVPVPVPRQVVVTSGDTLSGLEKRLGLPHGRLLDLNRRTLDLTAAEHGFEDSRDGALIFAGEVLRTS